MPRTQLTALQHDDELAPVGNEMLRPGFADLARDEGMQWSLHALELAACEWQIPVVTVTDLDFDETRSPHESSTFLERCHVVGNAFQTKEFPHLSRVFARSATKPIARKKAPARPQHTQYLGEDRRLVWNLHHRVLREHHIEARGRKGQGPGLDTLAAYAVGETRSLDPPLHQFEQHRIDIDASHRAGAVLAHQKLIDHAEPAPDVEHLAAADVAALEHAGHLVGPSR